MLRIKKAVLTLICCAFVYVPLAGADAIREASFEINSGVRQDRLTWDTSGVVEYYDTYIVSSKLDWDELDIYDIPISYITNQFLEYLELMEELDQLFRGEEVAHA